MQFPRAPSKNVCPKTKNPLGFSASGPMRMFASESLGTTQRARHVAVMMMAMRPKIKRNAHLLSRSLNKEPSCVNANEARQKTDTSRAFFACSQN
jgi:hypothetical protein